MDVRAHAVACKALDIDEKPRARGSKIHPSTLQFVAEHLATYPNDDNFVITPREGTGFGILTCMEIDCFTDITLTAGYEAASDGGQGVGIGSLRPYADHIATHATHQTRRNARVAIQQAERKVAKPVVKALAGKSPNTTALKRKGSHLAPVKGEHADAPAPKKHNSSSSPSHGAPAAVASTSNGPAKPPSPVRANGAAVAAANNMAAQNAHAGFNAAQRNEIANAIQQIAQRIKDGEARKAQLEAIHPKTADDWAKHDENERRLAVDRDHYKQYTQAFANIGGQAAAAAAPVAPRVGDANLDILNVVDLGTDELADFLKSAFDDSFADDTTVEQARVKLGLPDMNTPVQGMVCGLLPHQLIGVAWMVGQEDSKFYGGVLADEMGLGKTVQTLGLMCHNLADDPKCRATLIVAPVALLEQWKLEIETKCEDNMYRILIHHGATKARSAKELQKYDVVLTSYGTLGNEYPDKVMFEKRQKRKDRRMEDPGLSVSSDDDDEGLVLKKSGPLFDVEWYRVVLDEAQWIRNRSTKTSRAVCDLDSLFRWCLTGTPMTNSLADFYGLLRFLQIKPWFNWREFNHHIASREKKDPTTAGKRMQAIFNNVGKRRKITDKIGDKPLIELPEKHITMSELDFSVEEREIYDFVEKRAQARFNKYLKAGTVLKNYSNVLVLLMRLRQVCLHPCLIASGMKEPEVDEDRLQGEWERAIKMLGNAPVRRIKDRRLEVALERREAEQAGDEAEEMDDCPVCMEPFANGDAEGIVTKCGHTFCRSCIVEVLEQGPDENENNYRADQRPCPTCRGAVSKHDIFVLAAFDPTDEEVEEAALAKKGKGRMLIDDDDDDDDCLPRAPVRRSVGSSGTKKKTTRVVDSEDEEEEEEISEKKENVKDQAVSRVQKAKVELPPHMSKQEPSTKMLWLWEELQRLQEENPEEKVIIISQFTSALDILDEFLHDKGVKAVRYQGDMNTTQRVGAVKRLMLGKKTKVMLMSLKSGGVGLNLTRANRVISFDLGWSPATEHQAWGRVHRIGQKRECFIERLTIKGTVEQRMLLLQEKKQALSDASLGEGDGAKLGRMTVGELAGLFGLNGYGRRFDESDGDF